jgi:hypothetical protein
MMKLGVEVRTEAEEVRRALATFANKLDSRLITRDDGKPYLWRGYLLGDDRDDQVNGFLHRFVSSDSDGFLHCHPWASSISSILEGEYVETSALGDVMGDGKVVLGEPKTVRYRPGMLNHIRPNTFHRVQLLTPEVWTLFIHGPRVQPWGFVKEGVYGEPLDMRVIPVKTSLALPKKIMGDGSSE